MIDECKTHRKIWRAHDSSCCSTVFHHTLCNQSQCWDWEGVLETGRHFWSVCLSICGWESGMYFLLGFSQRGLKWLEHMLSLSEGLLFWFAPAGDGIEPAWSLSIQAPVDPSEPRSSPEMRRHGADLLFRGYSSPVDKKTIELCCWNSQGWARAVQDERSAWTATERRETDRQREMSDPSDCSRRLPVSVISSTCQWKTEMGVLFAGKVADIPWDVYKKLKVKGEILALRT